jgi:hypothetical protein
VEINRLFFGGEIREIADDWEASSRMYFRCEYRYSEKQNSRDRLDWCLQIPYSDSGLPEHAPGSEIWLYMRSSFQIVC